MEFTFLIFLCLAWTYAREIDTTCALAVVL